MPASESDFDAAFLPLLDAIGRHHDNRILVGWGGGAEPAMKTALEEPGVTKGLVLLDVYPDGIEWLDVKRKNGWTDEQMLAFREWDLKARAGMAKVILMLAIPW
jgi:pimeloyl-ACP methyl ester carboxylesterase